MKKQISFYIFSLLAISVSFSSVEVNSQEDDAIKKQPVKYK